MRLVASNRAARRWSVALPAVGATLCLSASLVGAADPPARISVNRYRKAVQDPATAFSDGRLKGATFVKGARFLGKEGAWFAQGGQAVVFRAIDRDRQHWAVRCFLAPRDPEVANKRTEVINRHLESVRLPYLLPRHFLGQGISLKAEGDAPACKQPVELIPWAPGEKLSSYLRGASGRDIDRLLVEFPRMMSALREAGIAHGDLHPDNIYVDLAGNLTLIDYDGMSVPALRQRGAIGGRRAALSAPEFPHRALAQYRQLSRSVDPVDDARSSASSGAGGQGELAGQGVGQG